MIAALCTVRDAADLIPYLCGHYLRIGCDRVLFIDDGSTDGTFELLRRFAERDPRVRVEASPSEHYRKPDVRNEVMNRLIREGFDIIVPFDADEFWNVDAGRLRGLFGNDREAVIQGSWSQFVQERHVARVTPSSVLHVKRRAPVIPHSNRATVSAGQRPFVCHTKEKVIIRTTQAVSLDIGQHSVVTGPTQVVARGLELFHVPLRAASEIDRRARLQPRIRSAMPDPGVDWQSDYFQDAMSSGRTEVVWAANSAGPDGTLDLGLERYPAITDRRLQVLLLKALFYLVRHRLPLRSAGPARPASSTGGLTP